MNPVDFYLEGKVKAAEDRDAADAMAFHAWKVEQTKPNLDALYKRFDSEMGRKAHLWSAGAKKVDPVGLRLDMKQQMMTAFETWDPNKAASLRTHVNNMLKRSQRYVGKYQNMAFIPEEKRSLITPISKAREALHQEFGVPPTHEQISSYLNQNPNLVPSKRSKGAITPKLIQTVDAYQIRDIPEERFDSDPTRRTAGFEAEQASMLHTALTDQERNVYDYLVGRAGKPKINKTGDIANRLGMSPSQVSRIRKRIEAKYSKYIR